MFPGCSVRTLNEEFTAEQIRILREAWPGYLRKIEEAGEDDEETSDEEMADMFG